MRWDGTVKWKEKGWDWVTWPFKFEMMGSCEERHEEAEGSVFVELHARTHGWH